MSEIGETHEEQTISQHSSNPKEPLKFDLWRKKGRGGVAFSKLRQDIRERGEEVAIGADGMLIAPKGREGASWFSTAKQSKGTRFRSKLMNVLHALNPHKK